MADKPRLKLSRAPCGPIATVWAARVDDWIDDGSRIVRLSMEHRRNYRATVCARCSHEQQVRRKCSALTPGCDKKSCAHMDRAFYSKHRNLIMAHFDSHPLSQRLRMNAALDDSPKDAVRDSPQAAPGRPEGAESASH